MNLFIFSAYNVPPAPNNFIYPGKRPMSSMSTTIVVDDQETINSWHKEIKNSNFYYFSLHFLFFYFLDYPDHWFPFPFSSWAVGWWKYMYIRAELLRLQGPAVGLKSYQQPLRYIYANVLHQFLQRFLRILFCSLENSLRISWSLDGN